MRRLHIFEFYLSYTQVLDVIDEKTLTKLRRALVEVVDSFIMLICYPLPECVLCTTSFVFQNLNANIVEI